MRQQWARVRNNLHTSFALTLQKVATRCGTRDRVNLTWCINSNIIANMVNCEIPKLARFSNAQHPKRSHMSCFRHVMPKQFNNLLLYFQTDESNYHCQMRFGWCAFEKWASFAISQFTMLAICSNLYLLSQMTNQFLVSIVNTFAAKRASTTSVVREIWNFLRLARADPSYFTRCFKLNKMQKRRNKMDH